MWGVADLAKVVSQWTGRPVDLELGLPNVVGPVLEDQPELLLWEAIQEGR